MTQSQPALELILSLQTRIAKLEQDNQQLQAELAQLRRSEARYRQLFENAPLSILFINTEGYITEMNQASEYLFGLPIEQLNSKVANLLLKSPDYTTVLFDVVRLLGEAVGSDRCSINQDTVHPTSGKLAVKLLVRWDKPGIVTTNNLTPEYEGCINLCSRSAMKAFFGSSLTNRSHLIYRLTSK